MRVAVSTNSTYRLAVYRVKGGFKYRFNILPIQKLHGDTSGGKGDIPTRRTSASTDSRTCRWRSTLSPTSSTSLLA